jgi:hypothetical protein
MIGPCAGAAAGAVWRAPVLLAERLVGGRLWTCCLTLWRRVLCRCEYSNSKHNRDQNCFHQCSSLDSREFTTPRNRIFLLLGCIRLRQLFAFQIPLQEYQVARPARPAKKPEPAGHKATHSFIPGCRIIRTSCSEGKQVPAHPPRYCIRCKGRAASTACNSGSREAFL